MRAILAAVAVTLAVGTAATGSWGYNLSSVFDGSGLIATIRLEGGAPLSFEHEGTVHICGFRYHAAVSEVLHGPSIDRVTFFTHEELGESDSDLHLAFLAWHPVPIEWESEDLDDVDVLDTKYAQCANSTAFFTYPDYDMVLPLLRRWWFGSSARVRVPPKSILDVFELAPGKAYTLQHIRDRLRLLIAELARDE